jgi:pimeloyl-ACP methyl ester carboxylesterase
MSYAENDGVKIYYEESGAGVALVFLHEFLNDHTGWDDQMRRFSRDYRCVTIAARGYPPSDCPEDEAAYGQDIFKNDVLAVLDHLKIDKAHLVGLSMGAYTGLQLAIENPDRVLSVVAASGGAGGYEPNRAAFEEQTANSAAQLESMENMPGVSLASGATRVQLKRKDPISWNRVAEIISRRPVHSAAKTMRQVQLKRPPVYKLEKELAAVKTPVLLMVGDEDESCLDVNLWLKRVMASARMVVFPACGHVLHLEEPELFNHLSEQFLSSVDRGTWYPRDPATMPGVAGTTAVSLGDGKED